MYTLGQSPGYWFHKGKYAIFYLKIVVFILQIRLKRRAMFWFVFADSYDVKEDSKHTCLVLGT